MAIGVQADSGLKAWLQAHAWSREGAPSNREKEPTNSWAPLAGGTLAMLLIVNICLNVIWLTTRHGLNDLGSFLHSGAAYHQHVNPYSYQSWLLPHPISREGLNLNPPVSVYLFDHLSRLPSSFVENLFVIGSIAMLTVAVAALLLAYPEKRNLLVVLAVLSMAGIWHMLWYLQLYAPLILLVTVAWLLLRRGDEYAAGVLLGLVVAAKPNFGLVLLCLLAARHFRVALPGLASAALVSAVPLLLDGTTLYRQWFDLTFNFKGVAWTSNASLVSVGARLDLPIFGFVLAATALAMILAWQWRKRPPVLECLALGLIAALLFGPVSWAGYTLFLLPFLMAKPWDWGMWCVILLLDIPFAPQQIARVIGISGFPNAASASGDLALHALTSSVYVWAVLLLLQRVTSHSADDSEEGEGSPGCEDHPRAKLRGFSTLAAVQATSPED